jgi:uncharacterized protein (TIGR02145 family)
VESCGPLSSRTSLRADFNQTATNTQVYTFTPTAAVSNVRFYYVNTNGQVIQSLTGGNAGTNITGAVTATVVYNTALSSSTPGTTTDGLAYGTTANQALTADIYVVYNNNGTNTGTDLQIKLTANVKDCACCGAYISTTEWKEFLCHNLGADYTLDPHNMGQTNAWALNGAYIHWGRRGPSPTNNPLNIVGLTGDSRDDWQSYPSRGSIGFAAAPTSASPNSTSVSGWLTTGGGNNAWRTSGGLKTNNDPCPSGYRVPTSTEWQGVTQNNSAHRTTPFTTSTTNYGAALHYGPLGTTNVKMLTLPAAGGRTSTDGTLNGRGSVGSYWSSTENGTGAYFFRFDNTNANPLTDSNRANGFIIRCIKE